MCLLMISYHANCWLYKWLYTAITSTYHSYIPTLTVLVKVDASDIVMINHVLHDYAERVSNAAWHHSTWLYWCTTSWVHDAVMYDWIVYTSSIINRITWSFTPPLHSYDVKYTKWNLLNDTFGTRITRLFLRNENSEWKFPKRDFQSKINEVKIPKRDFRSEI